MDSIIKKSQIIHIVLATDDNYTKQCCVTIASILFNSNKSDFYHFHILDGGLTEKSKERFKLKRFNNYDLTFYDMKNFDLSKFCIVLDHISIATYYRLFITEILPKNIDKVIYLDCDLIVLKDIKEFWNFDIKKQAATVIEDMLPGEFDYLKPVIDEKFNYFNAGVILFNLKKLREINFSEKCLNFYNQYRDALLYQDQDVLNYVLACKCNYAPISWDMQTNFYIYNHSKTINKKHFKYFKENPSIIHYTGPYKPWNFSHFHFEKNKYQKYILMVNSPFENLLYCFKSFCCFIFSKQLAPFYKRIKIFNLPIYELSGFKRKIIKTFGIPVYYKFRVKNRFREYLFGYRIR